MQPVAAAAISATRCVQDIEHISRVTENFRTGRALDGHTLCFVGGWEAPCLS